MRFARWPCNGRRVPPSQTAILVRLALSANAQKPMICDWFRLAGRVALEAELAEAPQLRNLVT